MILLPDSARIAAFNPWKLELSIEEQSPIVETIESGREYTSLFVILTAGSF
jgi:hypothetical protein